MAWPITGVTQWDIDPDLDELPTSITAVETDELFLIGLHVVNTSGVDRTVTVTDTAGLRILYQIPVDEFGVTKEFPLMRVVGLKWTASGAGVEGKYWGNSNA